MVCPNCNSINTGQHCYVHNIMTCLNCLYQSPDSFCDELSFIKQSEKFKAKRKAEMDKLLNMIPKDNTWIPQ